MYCPCGQTGLGPGDASGLPRTYDDSVIVMHGSGGSGSLGGMGASTGAAQAAIRVQHFVEDARRRQILGGEPRGHDGCLIIPWRAGDPMSWGNRD